MMTLPTTTEQNTNHAVNNMTNAADRAIDSTRSYTNHALDVADEKIHSLRNGFQPALDKFSRKAGEYAHQGMDMAANAKDKARESLSNYSAATGRYVSDKPMQSVLIAAAVGAVVALLVSSSRNRNRY